MKYSELQKTLSLKLNDIHPDKHDLFASVVNAVSIPRAFEDSTNVLTELTFENGEQAVLKQCRSNSLKDSDFWIGMQSLFSLNFAQSMGGYKPVYALLTQQGGLAVPQLLGADSASDDFSGFLCTSKLPGTVLCEPQVTDAMIEQLAEHLARLHQNQNGFFGPAFNPCNSAKEWWPKVFKSIRLLAEKRGVELSIIDFESEQACPDVFVPILPDLRWDQFLTDSNKLTGLVDLDAVVYGARELEFVLLEYLLSEQQAGVFKKVYEGYQPIPGLTVCREPYRWLLFFMNVLGEQSHDAWMQAPTRF